MSLIKVVGISSLLKERQTCFSIHRVDEHGKCILRKTINRTTC